jgi:hypothetical protein
MIGGLEEPVIGVLIENYKIFDGAAAEGSDDLRRGGFEFAGF